MRSCGVAVFVDESAEAIHSFDLFDGPVLTGGGDAGNG
jgi:hypothetical protein